MRAALVCFGLAIALSLAALLVRGERGTLDEPCKPDGTCSAPALSCQYTGMNLMTGAQHYRCLPRTAP